MTANAGHLQHNANYFSSYQRHVPFSTGNLHCHEYNVSDDHGDVTSTTNFNGNDDWILKMETSVV